MAGFHINRETDRVNKCDADVRNCPVGGAHFDTKDEATKYKNDLHEKANPKVNTLKKPRGKQLTTKLREANGKLSDLKQEKRKLESEKNSLANEYFGKEIVKNSPEFNNMKANIEARELNKAQLEIAREEVAKLQEEYDKKHPPKPAFDYNSYYSGGSCGGSRGC